MQTTLYFYPCLCYPPTPCVGPKGSASEQDPIILDDEDAGALSTGGSQAQVMYEHMWYRMLPEQQRTANLAAAHRANSIFFFKHNIPFHIVNSKEFRAVIKASQNCPVYVPVDRRTLSGPHLEARDAEATAFNLLQMKSNAVFGFTITGDGYASLTKRAYHNHILIAGGIPIFLGLVDRTWIGATGEDIAEEFEEIMDGLDIFLRRNLIFGVTDTPSANRKAWRLLMESNPNMYWGGCMAHEISLYMGDIAKMECSKRLMDKCHKLYKWIMHHVVGDASLLGLFQEKVLSHFQAKYDSCSDPKARRACAARKTMTLYKKGDTRMLSIFKLLFRTLSLMGPLVATFGDARYKAMAQKVIRQYNGQATRERRIKKNADGTFFDSMFNTFGAATSEIWDEIETWLQANLSIVYFLRIVDTHEPSLHMVYYCSALNDKHLRVLASLDESAIWLQNMSKNFETRWARWHLHIHTLAYHFNPKFREHPPSRGEMRECQLALERLWPTEAAEILVSLKHFKASPMALGLKQEDVNDLSKCIPHLWYRQYDHILPESFAKAGMQLCAQPSSASVAKQGVVGWSKVGAIETIKRTRILTAKTNKLVNVNGWLWAAEKAK